METEIRARRVEGRRVEGGGAGRGAQGAGGGRRGVREVRKVRMQGTGCEIGARDAWRGAWGRAHRRDVQGAGR